MAKRKFKIGDKVKSSKSDYYGNKNYFTFEIIDFDDNDYLIFHKKTGKIWVEAKYLEKPWWL